jgi:hypothetical protein
MKKDKLFSQIKESLSHGCWFHLDGASDYWAEMMSKQIDEVFPHRWINRDGPLNL